MSRSALRAALTLWMLCAAAGAGCASGDDPTGSPSSAPGSPTPPPCDDPPCYGAPASVGAVASDAVPEVSGMAASVRTPGVYYAVSDEAGTSQVAVLREDGRLVGRLTIDGMDAANAEAMAVGPCGDAEGSGTCFYVGDIGDHVGRPDVAVYRVPEPDLDEQIPDALDADELRYTYPDAPVDAEALMVDEAGRPLIISKTELARLYRGSPASGQLEELTEIDLPEPRTQVLTELTGNVVTGASAADDSVLVRTYDEVLEYRAPESAVDLVDFPAWSLSRAPAPPQIQSETVTHRVDDCGYVTTSELTGDIHAVPCIGADE